VVDVDQHAQGGRGEVVDLGEVQEDLGAVLGLDQGGEGLADLGDVGLVEDLAFDEVDDLDVLVVGDVQPLRCVRHGWVSVGQVDPGWTGPRRPATTTSARATATSSAGTTATVNPGCTTVSSNPLVRASGGRRADGLV